MQKRINVGLGLLPLGGLDVAAVCQSKMITRVVANCLYLIQEVYEMLTFEKVKRDLCLQAVQWDLG